jgi:putative ABC transport system permease protein
MMLARRNLLHDRVRFVVTLTGIVFAVVLSSIQLGLFVGFRRATSDLIAHSGADVWVRSSGVTHLESGVRFDDHKRYEILAVPGVADAQSHIVGFGQWKRPDGADEGVLVIGLERRGVLGQPWNLVEGSIARLDERDAVIVDELYKKKLGISRVGEVFEIRGVRARVVGFTRGIRSFTTAPPVFTTIDNARRFLGFQNDETLYVLVKAKPGVQPEAVAQAINTRVRDVEATPTDAWRIRQESYWMFGTGAGVTVLIAAGLGLLVGVVVVAQTIYAATIDHIREYGTLKAMGATNAYLLRVIITQAIISALVGGILGVSIGLTAAHASQSGTTAIIVPAALAGALLGLTVLMCVIASLVSINKVVRLDPAIVFKG